MKKFLLVVTLFLSSFAYSQVTIVNNTNLNGFILTGSAWETKFSDRIELKTSNSLYSQNYLDTMLNLVGYDSLKISFTIWQAPLSAMSFLNGIAASQVPLTYAISSTNITKLSLSISLFPTMSFQGDISIKGLKIIGFPSAPTAINENKNLGNNEFVCLKDKFIFNGNIKSQKLIVYDVLGNIVMNKNLEETNPIDLSTGVYLVRIIDNGNVVYNKKLLFGK